MTGMMTIQEWRTRTINAEQEHARRDREAGGLEIGRAHG